MGVIAIREHPPGLGLVAPSTDLVVFRVTGQTGGRLEASGARVALFEIDMHRRRQEGEPATYDEQSPVLVKGLAGVQQNGDV